MTLGTPSNGMGLRTRFYKSLWRHKWTTHFLVGHDLHRIPGNVFHRIRPDDRHEVVHGPDCSQHGKTEAQWFWTFFGWQYIFRKLFLALKWQTILIFIFWFYKFASFSSKWNPRIICETHQEENYDTQMCCDTPFEKHIIQMTISVLAFLSNDKTTCMTYVNFITEDGGVMQ